MICPRCGNMIEGTQQEFYDDPSGYSVVFDLFSANGGRATLTDIIANKVVYARPILFDPEESRYELPQVEISLDKVKMLMAALQNKTRQIPDILKEFFGVSKTFLDACKASVKHEPQPGT